MKVNQRQLAEIFGKSQDAIKKWQGDGMPIEKRAKTKGKQNEYDTAKVYEWLLARFIDEHPREMDIERTRLLRAQAEKHEIELELLRENVIDIHDAEYVWCKLANHVKTGILSIPSRVSPIIVGENNIGIIKDTIQREIEIILNNIGNNPPKIDKKEINKRRNKNDF